MTLDEKESLKKEIKGSAEIDDENALQRRNEFKNEILAAIEKDSLKTEILDELKPKKTLWKKLEHPALLLLIGFVLTTGLGGILTYFWQYKQWKGQQEYIQKQNELERARITQQAIIKQKYDIKDETIRAIAEINTAGEEILISFTWDPKDRRRKTGAPNLTKAWREASKNWRINSKIILQKITYRFVNPEISKSFGKMMAVRSEVGNKIASLQNRIEQSSEKILKDKSFEAEVYSVNGKLSDFISLSNDLMKAMTEEIQANEGNTEISQQSSPS